MDETPLEFTITMALAITISVVVGMLIGGGTERGELAKRGTFEHGDKLYAVTCIGKKGWVKQ